MPNIGSAERNKNYIYPFEIQDRDDEIISKYPEYKNKYIYVGPKRFCCYKFEEEVLQKYYNFEIRPDDVWLFGFPRSGTTLAQEIVWLIANDLDFEKASTDIIDVRFPVFETHAHFKDQFEVLQNDAKKYREEISNIIRKWARPAWEIIEEMQGRRFSKTHLPMSLGPPNLLTSGCKIFYLARNPKDVFVSCYYALQAFDCENWIKTKSNFEASWEHFQSDLYGSYFKHIKEGWELRNHENVMFLFYEEYTKDLRNYLVKIAKFLGKSLTEDQLDKLENHLKIDNFRKNKSVNNDHLKELGLMAKEDDAFIRKGGTGGWREYFKNTFNSDADKWIEENLKDTDLRFPQI